MAGPYFKNQLPAPCGCYYPDVTRIRDDQDKHERILFCIKHGVYSVPLGEIERRLVDSTPLPIRDEKWREAERQCLRSS